MRNFSEFSLGVGNTLQFNQDDTLPLDISNQSFEVTQVNTLIINDVYFNHDLFSCYELTGTTGNKIYLTPFQYEADNNEVKLRITKEIEKEDLLKLFSPQNAADILDQITKDSNYLSLEEKNISCSLEKWISKTYYADLKDQELAVCYYVQFDARNKKNLNYSRLLEKYPSKKYTLFAGDCNLFYLEANVDAPEHVKVTVFLSPTDIAYTGSN